MEAIIFQQTRNFLDLSQEETVNLTNKCKIFFTDKDRYIADYLGTDEDSAVLMVWIIRNVEKNFKKLKKKSIKAIFKKKENLLEQLKDVTEIHVNDAAHSRSHKTHTNTKDLRNMQRKETPINEKMESWSEDSSI